MTTEPASHPAAQQLSTPALLGLASILLVAGLLSWWLHFRPIAELDPHSIAAIPIDLEEWSGHDIPMRDSVESMLRADAHVQRIYTLPSGEGVWLYVGYYGTRRGGRPEHTPWACYPSNGWTVERRSVQALRLSGVPVAGAHFNEILVEKDGARRLVHFWYATHRSRAIASEGALTLDHLMGRLSTEGRADGALVRLSTPIDRDGLEGARSRLLRFTTDVVPWLREAWPNGLASNAPDTLTSITSSLSSHERGG